MSQIQLLYTTTRKPFSALIRTVTWSRWSHVALIDGDQIIESVVNGGVRQYPLRQAIDHTADHCIVELTARNPQAILDAARSQIGKPYDWTAILGLGLHRDWQEDDSWFCSELVAWAAAEVGEHWFRREALRRVTPQHLWMLPPHKAPGIAAI